MNIINIDDNFKQKDEIAIALGNFDGLHLGHQTLISTMKKEAEKNRLKSSVLLFKKHTRTITKKKNSITLLTNNEQKVSILEKFNIDTIYAMDFNESLMNLEGEEFVKNILVERLNVKLVVVGFNYKFGYKASCDSQCLRSLGKKYGFDVVIVNPVYKNHELISSTLIRSLIKNGDISKANKLLGRFYIIEGIVVEGKKRGRKLGFPTANLKISDNFTIPKNGVYETITIFEGVEYPSVTNIGNNPTFNDIDIKIENHLIDFQKHLYGSKLKIVFKRFMREEIKYNSEIELKEQILKDIQAVKENY